MGRIADKVVVITGASSGIGAATARHLAEKGARVVLAARRTVHLDSLVHDITINGGQVISFVADVTLRGDVVSLVEHAIAYYGQVDVFVNNAGIGPISPLDDLRVDEWEQMVDVNIKGLLFGIAASLPVFRAQRFGHFIAVASTAGMKTVPTQTVYSGTKFAVRAICEGLRQEAGPDLRVTVVSPGAIKTPFVEGIANAEVRARYIGLRDDIAIEPSAIARAIAFAIEQPSNVDVGEIVVRPTAQA
ncbi:MULTISPECIES: SDR family oxidoreductase [unclassified Rhizobium]|uniref:SDR family oxidoreductase n=1 Tax=unclassified Rhizobium TaxID=2613769 RepID=UPI000BD52C08|nr:MULTISPECIES: SDR family oxidoreductase [unclassified Rhizobium]MDH7808750.1 NADP-dependent 3-hydroxy acid dehydrogenase YdfG [Rhizobium sp. AN67]MDQ4409210.1 SDR family oxidoreductase [Rhizobium sp. AN63]SOD50903.1 NADP-dependent 3-hydroxy acid dehydrogenase YdfG [Rhizobium sp. AN6A]